MTYNHKQTEEKWRKYWEDNKTFKTDAWDFSKPKFYALDMFPYPSGAGLHVGHPEGYTATDIVSRKKRMEGYNVLHPMGFDSFGLPAEQYAISTGNHPEQFTKDNIAFFIDFSGYFASCGYNQVIVFDMTQNGFDRFFTVERIGIRIFAAASLFEGSLLNDEGILPAVSKHFLRF